MIASTTLVTPVWRRPEALAVGAAAGLTFAAGVTAYYQTFRVIQPYDDEGTLIDLVRRFMAGQPLYDIVPSVYGPAYFLYQFVAHGLAGTMPTNDTVRFVTLAFWLAANLLVFALAWRSTRSIPIASGAYLVAFWALRFLGIEPAHPQELCLVLVLALVLAGSYTAFTTRLMFSLGGLAGAMLMTKINIGAIAIVTLGLVLSHAAGHRFVRAAAIVSAIAFPVLLMAPLLSMSWARRFLALEELWLLALMVVMARSRFDVRIGPRELVMISAGFLGVVAMLAVWLVVHGSSLMAMFDWLIVRPRAAVGPAWFWEPNLRPQMVWWAVAGLIAAMLAQTHLARPWMIPAMKLGLGLGVIVLMYLERPQFLITAVAPFLWLVMIPGGFSRTLMAATGVLVVLYEFPIAGASQIDLIAVVFIVVTAVIFADGVSWLIAQMGRFETWPRRLTRAFLAVSLVKFCVLDPLQARRDYAHLVPLDFPGAWRLHLEGVEAAALRRLVQTARASCTMLLTVPGMPSFNFWTGIPAPGGIYGGDWVTGTSDALHEQVIRQLASEPRPCVIHSKEMMDMWTHGADIEGRPAMRFVRQHFHPAVEGRANVLLLR